MELQASRGAVLLGYGASDFGTAIAALDAAGVPSLNRVLVNNPDGSGMTSVGVGSVGQKINPEKNLGYGHGMNVGYAALPHTVDAIMLLTPGVTLEPQETKEAFDLFQSSPDIGACGPILRSVGGDIISAGGALSSMFKPSHLRKAPSVGNNFVGTDWVDGAAVLVRSTLFPLPEEYFLYWEDVALSIQARRAGMRVGVLPQWAAMTSPGAGGRRDLFRYLYWRNRLICARQLGGPSSFLASLAALVMAMAVRPLLQRLTGNSSEARRTARLLGQAFKDGLRGRSGPPPDFVIAGSDVRLP